MVKQQSRPHRNARARTLVAVLAATTMVGSPMMAAPAVADDPVVVDVGERHQEVRGFGAMSHSAWIGDLTPAQRDTAFDNGADDLGFSMLRIPVPESRAAFDQDLETARAAAEKGAIVFASPWNPPAEFTESFAMEPPAVGSKYEAEAGVRVDAAVSTAQPGYEGAGYVEFGADSGASVRFDGISLGSTGMKNLAFRYALAEGSRTVDIYLDGTLAAEDVVFPATGGAAIWARKHVQLQMTSGQRSVRIETTGTGGPALDNVQVSAYVAPGDAQRLRYDRYAEYAAYLDEFVVHMRENGVELYAISMQNEPDYAHEWTWWTPTEIVRFLRDFAGGISTRVIAPESFQYRKEMSDPILNDPQALANTDIIGAHLYGTAIDDFDYPLFEEKGAGKELWMTEVYTPNSTPDSADDWPQALQVAEHIHHAMTEAEFQAYVWWYLRRSYGPMKEDGSISKRGYSMAHYAKFVRPGDVRVEATANPSEGVLTSAYLREDGSIAVIAINSSLTAVDQQFDLPGVTIEAVTAWTSDAARNMAEIADPAHSSDGFAGSLPAQSVTTFVVQADGGEGIPISADIDAAGEGSLALSVAAFGDVLDLGAADSVGDRLRASGELPELTVTDSRTAAQAGEGGWSVTGRADTFRGPQEYGGEHLGWSPQLRDGDPGVELGSDVSTVLAGGEGLAPSRILARADQHSRTGSTRLSADLSLELPIETAPGVYTGAIIISLFPED
jgi:glucuronoarabinoxylan endo-1,4-beta-xylanase